LNHKNFVHVGKLLFKEQPDRIHTHGSKDSSSLASNSIIHSTDDDKQDTISPSEGAHDEISPRSGDDCDLSLCLDRLSMLYKFVFGLHAMYGYWALWLKSDPVHEEDVGEKIHHDCSEEMFHYAMYQTPSATTRFLDNDTGNIFPKLVAVCVLLIACFGITWASRVSRSNIEEKKVLVNTQQCTRTPTAKRAPVLQREMASLESKNVFPSCFIVDDVMSSGKIKSTRKSARISSMSSKATRGQAEECKCFKVDLLAEFNAEPKAEHRW